MTEQEKARGRRFIVSMLVAMLVIIGGAIIWHELNKPMRPVIVEFGDRYHVRWGNRFQPFVYEQSIDTGAEATWCQPADIERCLTLGRLFLDVHLHPEEVRKARLGGLYRF